MSGVGPGPLGRSIVVADGAEAPPAWADAPRVRVDEAALSAPAELLATLHAAWAERRPVVIEVAVDPARFRDPESIAGTPWELGVDLELVDDRLHFLLWANTWDARGGEPRWWWGVKAARLAEGAVATPEGPGDLRLADGTSLWVDGGPREPLARADLGGLGVVHRESVEAGRLLVAPEPVAPAADLTSSDPTHHPDRAGSAGTDLTPDQQAAVSHARGPARIVAPAGSGKTRVLTERLRHLLVDRGWEPSMVLAVAYNVKARDEMAERTEGLGARVQTLNGLAYGILAEARDGAPPVLEEREVRRLLDGLAPARRRRTNTDPIAPYIEALTEVRLGLRDPEAVERDRGDVPGLAGMVGPYRAELARRGAVDFDEQVAAATEALLQDGELRRRVQARHRHLLVDEFQDLTPAHLLLLRLVAGPPLDVFGVGDDDQVIYGHAGADPRFLIDFARWFPGGGEHALEVNHRCAAPIVGTARTLLTHNERRVAKVIRARPDAPGSPDAVRVMAHSSSGGAEALVDAVRGWLDAGHDPTSIAVLGRVHSLLLAPHVALVEAGIPVYSTVGPDILERTGARAALAYLRIAANPEAIAPDDLAEVYRRPSRGLPQWIVKWFRRPMTVAQVASIASRLDDLKVAEKVTALAADLGVVARAGSSTRHALEVIRDQVGLGEAMAGLDRSKGGEGSSQLDDLEALIQVADLHPALDGFEEWLRSSLQGGARRDEPAVTLSTVHRVKGREWPRVVVTGVTAGLLPHRLAVDEEEERRVLHVAVTRAREQVVVLGDAGRPSPFLAELGGAAPASSDGAGEAAARPVPGPVSKSEGPSSSRPTPTPASEPEESSPPSSPATNPPPGPERTGSPSSRPVAGEGGRSAPAPSPAAPSPEAAAVGAAGPGSTPSTLPAAGPAPSPAPAPSPTVSADVSEPEEPAQASMDALLGLEAPAPRDEGRGAANRPLDGPAAAREAALKEWRKERCQAESVPAYVVASDATLRTIAEVNPKAMVELATIPGIGPAKLKRYGDGILAVLAGTGG